MNAFELKNISFSHKDQKIFNLFNLSHAQGEVNLWLGPSGVGKTSLGKIICSHLTLNSGEILVHGEIVKTASKDRLYVGHENDLFLWQTLQQHIDFLINNVVRTKPPAMTDVKHWLSLLEIEDLLSKYPGQISMGQIRRFQILRSLLLNSELVIFDETLSALDKQLKLRILPKLYDLWKSRKTSVVIISHESEVNFNINFDQIVDFSKVSFLNDK